MDDLLSEANMDHSYHPIRRINQACLNCRRKKARCTGERPKCSNCKRLMTDCHYSHSDSRKRRLSASSDIVQSYMIADSLREIGCQLAEIKKQLNNNSSPSNAAMQNAVDENTRGGPQNSISIHRESPGQAADDVFTPLPPRDLLVRAINTFFSHCHNQPYSIFHEGTFRRQFAQMKIPNHTLFAILCNSFRFLNTSIQNRQQISELYAGAAWSLIKSKCFSGDEDSDIRTVQTLALLSIYDFTGGRKRHSASWVRIGIAIRLAQQLRLMREPDSTLPPEEQEERRRIFWSLYLLDRLVSCGRNQPLAIADASCHLRLPCDEISWRTSKIYTQQPYLIDVLDRKSTEYNLSVGGLVIIAAKCLTRCTQYMLQDNHNEAAEDPWHPRSDFASISSDLLFLESLLSFHRQLDQVLKEDCSVNGAADSQLAGPVVFARLLFCLCQCILNHPFLLQTQFNCNRTTAPPSFITRSLDTCHEFAGCLTNSIREARQAGFSSHTSFGGYCMAIAGTIHVLFTFSENGLKRDEAQRNLDFSLDYLRGISNFWLNSRPMLHKLEEILNISNKTYKDSAFEQCQEVFHDTELYRSFWELIDYNTISRSLEADSLSFVTNEHLLKNNVQMTDFEFTATGQELGAELADFIQEINQSTFNSTHEGDHLLQEAFSPPPPRTVTDSSAMTFNDDAGVESMQYLTRVFTNIYEESIPICSMNSEP